MLQKVNIRSEVPVYEQIENEVAFAVAAGKLKDGDQLPAVREVADKVGVNANTISKSFRDLELRGYVNAMRGRGIFIERGATEKCRKDCRRHLVRNMYRVLSEAKSMGTSRKDLDEIIRVCLSVDGSPYEELPAEVVKLAEGR